MQQARENDWEDPDSELPIAAGPELCPPEWSAAWAEELARRSAEIESGEVVGIPAEEVFAKLRARFKEQQ